MYLKSKLGEIQHISKWEEELNKFWAVFDGSRNIERLGNKLPKRPDNAWERYVKLMGLEHHE